MQVNVDKTKYWCINFDFNDFNNFSSDFPFRDLDCKEDMCNCLFIKKLVEVLNPKMFVLFIVNKLF